MCVTRRTVLQAGLGFSIANTVFRATGFAPREFWNQQKPGDWSPAEVKELLTKSPWAKDASIDDRGDVGLLGGPRSGGGRRGERPGTPASGSSSGPPPKITWKAIVRWESALPVREAMKKSALTDVRDFYVLNLIGNLPSAIPTGGGANEEQALSYLKQSTVLQHKGDEVHLDHVMPVAENEFSQAGTLFYFSRMLALMPEDREATFLTKIGPLDVKCKFALKDMLYHGKLEL